MVFDLIKFAVAGEAPEENKLIDLDADVCDLFLKEAKRSRCFERPMQV